MPHHRLLEGLAQDAVVMENRAVLIGRAVGAREASDVALGCLTVWRRGELSILTTWGMLSVECGTSEVSQQKGGC